MKKTILNKFVVAFGSCVATAFLFFDASLVAPLAVASYAQEAQAEPDYCVDHAAFAERFIRPEFPQNAPEDEQRGWYLKKKICGRDLIKLSLAKWPAFEERPQDASEEAWAPFVAAAALSRNTIAEKIFDENHGGTLIKKYYSTDYEPDKIAALYQTAVAEVASVKSALKELTNDAIYRSARCAEFDAFWADFSRWFAPYCRASFDKLPSQEQFLKEPDNFLAAADLLEFAVDYVPTDERFVATLEKIKTLLADPNASRIRVFHGRYEGDVLVSYKEIFARYCARIDAVNAKRTEERLQPELIDASVFNDRQTDLFEHGSLPKWGAKDANQRDQFYIVFPKEGACENRPLYVVLHSAGHSAKTALDCTLTIGNHDIYRVPDDFYGIFVDCRINQSTDWWWGGRRADEPEINDGNAFKATSELQPVEKRVLDEIAWAIDEYKIDANRVYLCGNSMGGSGTLGLGLPHGDVFAAVKANVPAGVWHAYDRLQLGEEDAPEGLHEPPVCFDYSAPNDNWSAYHEALFEGVEARKYSYVAYWGNHGHENNDEKVAKHNDLFKTFDWTLIRKDEAYPVFTNASTDSAIPWPERPENAPAGQRGAYFRWQNKVDAENEFAIELRLASKDELQSKIFEIPTESIADVSLRRLQNFRVEPNETVTWSFGAKSGEIVADKNGLVTIPELTIADAPTTLKLSK